MMDEPSLDRPKTGRIIRDGKGRYAKGTRPRPGPGRPPRPIEESYFGTLKANLTQSAGPKSSKR